MIESFETLSTAVEDAARGGELWAGTGQLKQQPHFPSFHIWAINWGGWYVLRHTMIYCDTMQRTPVGTRYNTSAQKQSCQRTIMQKRKHSPRVHLIYTTGSPKTSPQSTLLSLGSIKKTATETPKHTPHSLCKRPDLSKDSYRSKIYLARVLILHNGGQLSSLNAFPERVQGPP